MIRIDNLNKSFGSLHVLKDISIRLEERKVLVLIGPSGTGKSTLLRCINYLEKPDSGIITIDQFSVDAKNHKKNEEYELRARTAMVFQNYSLFKNKTALENIMEPLTAVQKIPKKEAEGQAREILEAIGLTEKADSYPSQLSGGQQQRVAIARAVVSHPDLVLADEPTGNLDSKNGAEVMRILSELNAAGTTIVMVTHNKHDAEYAARVVEMLDGKIVSTIQNKNL